MNKKIFSISKDTMLTNSVKSKDKIRDKTCWTWFFFSILAKKVISMKKISYIPPEGDFSAVVHVLNAAHGTVAEQFGFTRETNPTNNAFIDEATLRAQLSHGIRLYGLTVDEVLIGCIAVEESTKEAETFYIEKVSVLPEYRNQGYGVQLMDFATDLIQKAGGRFVSIALIDSHTKLKQWYVSQGFLQTGTKAFERLPFVVCFMSKQIPLNPSTV